MQCTKEKEKESTGKVVDGQARAPKGDGMYRGPRAKGLGVRTKGKVKAKKVRAKVKVLARAHATTAGSQATLLAIARMQIHTTGYVRTAETMGTPQSTASSRSECRM